MSNSRHRGGLTLVEILVAMSILAGTLTGFLAVFMMNQRTVLVANNQQRAMHQARGVLEDLFSLSYYDARLSVGSHVVDSGCSYSVAETNRVKTIAVTLTWKNALEPKTTSFVLTTAVSQAIHK